MTCSLNTEYKIYIKSIFIKKILFLMLSNSGKDNNLKIMAENVLIDIASTFFGILAINLLDQFAF